MDEMDEKVPHGPKIDRVRMEFATTGVDGLRLDRWQITIEGRHHELSVAVKNSEFSEQDRWHSAQWGLLLYMATLVRRRGNADRTDAGQLVPVLEGGSGSVAEHLVNHIVSCPSGTLETSGEGASIRRSCLDLFFPVPASNLLKNSKPGGKQAGREAQSGMLGLFLSASGHRSKGQFKLFVNLEMLDPEHVEVWVNGRGLGHEPAKDHAGLDDLLRRLGLLEARRNKPRSGSSVGPGHVSGGPQIGGEVSSRKLAPLGAVRASPASAWRSMCKSWVKAPPEGFDPQGAERVASALEQGEVFPGSRDLVLKLAQRPEAWRHAWGRDCQIYLMEYTSLVGGLMEQQRALSDAVRRVLPEMRVKLHSAVSTECLREEGADEHRKIFVFPTFELKTRKYLGVLPYGAITELAWLMHSRHPAAEVYHQLLGPERVKIGRRAEPSYFRASEVQPEGARGWMALCLHLVGSLGGRLFVEDGSFQISVLNSLLANPGHDLPGGFDLLCRSAREVVRERKENVASNLFNSHTGYRGLRDWIAAASDATAPVTMRSSQQEKMRVQPDRDFPRFAVAFDPTMAPACLKEVPKGFSILTAPLPGKHFVPLGVGFTLPMLPQMLVARAGWQIRNEAIRIFGRAQYADSQGRGPLIKALEPLGFAVQEHADDHAAAAVSSRPASLEEHPRLRPSGSASSLP